MATTAAGVSITTVTNETAAGTDNAEQLAPLGFELSVPAISAGNVAEQGEGEHVWIYVKNVSGAALAAGDLCRRDWVSAAPAGESLNVIKTPTTGVNAGQVVGVAQHAIGDNGFGFILRKGVGSVTSIGAVVRGAPVLVQATAAGASGTADDDVLTSTAMSFGIWAETNAGAGTRSAVLDCRG